MGPRGARIVVAAVACAAVGAAPASAARSLHSPGYRGTHRVPRTLPPPAPPATTFATGKQPRVLVDDGGTAHIVWNVSQDGQPDTLGYCRIRRGARACDATQALVPAQDYSGGNFPGGNADFGGPRVLAFGDQLALLTHRFPNQVVAPDGSTQDGNTYLYASSDGGSTFGSPALIGTGPLSGRPAVFGPLDAPRIGMISDTETGGPFFQAASAGQYTSQESTFGGDGYGSGLAASGDTVAGAWALLNNQIHVRFWTGQGDIYDPGTWTDAVVPGSRPRIASGPAGVFLESSPDGHALEVRPVTPGGVGGPVRIAATTASDTNDLVEDGSGRLLTAYVASGGGGVVQLVLRTSTDGGRRWSAPQPLLRRTIQEGIWDADIAATADGGGFAVAEQSSNGSQGPLLAVPFGPQVPTGRPGLGGLPGGNGDPSIVETCQRIAFGPVAVTAQEGCLLGTAQRGVKVSEGVLRLNGLEIVPDAGVKVLLNARARTIDTTGSVRVQLRAPGVPPVVLFHGELHLRVPGGAASAGARTRARAAARTGGCSGTQLFGFDSSGAKLEGFPIDGSIAVYLGPDSSCIPVSIGLPGAFGGVRGDATLRADNTRGLHVDTLRISVPQAVIGPLTISDLLITYAAAGDEWAGRATLGLSPQPGGARLGASVRFAGGRFKEGALRLDFPFPGISLDPFAVSYLSGIRGDFGLDPVRIGGGATIGVLPVPPSAYTFSVDGHLEVTFTSPVRLEFTGLGRFFGFPVANEDILVTTDGFVRARGSVGIDLDVASVNGGLDAFVDAPTRRFSGQIGGRVCAAGICTGGDAVVSSIGIGACIRSLADVGFGYRWGASLLDVDVMFGSCDLTPYELPAPARAAQAGAGSPFVVAGRTALTSLRIAGEGGAPSVVLVSPSGRTVTPAPAGTSGAEAFFASDAAHGVTWVAIRRPEAGTWQVQAAPGSPAIAEVRSATALPAPSVGGRIIRRGRSRVLAWNATARSGLRTTFVEQWGGGGRVLGVARGARGTLRIGVPGSPGGRHAIVALVEENGAPRLRQTIASYVAPAPARPGRVRRLSAAHRGRTLVVRWSAASGARAYAVLVRLSDGRALLRVVRARQRTLRVGGVARGVRANVTVSARDAAGRSGPPARARTRR